MLHKLLSIAILILIITQTNSDQLNEDYTFEDFKEQFQKAYSSQEEEQKREEYFNNNMKFIRDKWNVGIQIPVNNFLDYSQEELQSLSGFKPDQNIYNLSKSNPKFKVATGFAANPMTFDYRDLHKVTPVKQQGQCGSCWAFATTAQYQSLLLIYQSVQYDLAQQFLLQCSRAGSCDGGHPTPVLQFLKDTGIPLESQHPYKMNDTYNPSTCNSSAQNFIKLKKKINHVSYNVDIKSTDELKQLLVENGPLTVGVYANSKSWNFPETGGYISDCPSNFQVDHAVLLIGWTQTHWILKNSWGLNWGQGGYGKLPFNKDCGLSNHIWILQFQQGLSPNPQQTEKYTIEMTDSYGDGWNSNIMGLVQDNQYVATFGNNFTSGSAQTINNISIPTNKMTKIVVYQLGSYRNEVSFKLKRNNQLIFSYQTGTNFTKTTVFFQFCSGNKCSQLNIVQQYTVYLSDSFGDGWNGNALKFVQKAKQIKFGAEFTSGNSFPPFKVQFIKNETVSILPAVYGEWTQQLKIEIRDKAGYLVFSRPGKFFYPNNILGQFNPGSSNLLAVREVLETRNDNTEETTKEDSNEDSAENSNSMNENFQQLQDKKYLTLIIIIACLCLTVLVMVILFGVALIRIKKRNDDKEINDEPIQSGVSFKIPKDNSNTNVGM